MKKIMPLFFIASCLSALCHAQSIYAISFNDIDGHAFSFETYQGKRICMMVLAANSSDTGRLQELKAFSKVHSDSIELIGVLSIEDGYSPANKAAIKEFYKDIRIVLTDGMHTRKAAGASQSELMYFLTHKEANYRSDLDTQGLWQQFFISKTGRFNGVLPGGIPFLDPVVWRFLYKE